MTNKQRIAIIGAGGFGGEVFHLLDDDKYDCVGFIDYDKTKEDFLRPIIGHEDNMEELVSTYNFSKCVIAIGDMEKRRGIYEKLKNFDIQFPTIIHTSVQSYSKINKDGSILYPGIVIMNNCRIGKFTLLNSNVTLGHDVIIGDFCNINPGVHLAGKITIGEGTVIGLGATIKENINIGENVIIGAGSVVINDISENTMVYGVPAKVASL